MKPKPSLVALFIMGLSSMKAHAATPTMTPEAEAVFLGKYLKPIPDDEWKNIAGAQLTEKYTVVSGDTLSDISKRLFGDPKYWPKVWALNNDKITNPHRILPGNMIAFSTGTGSSLPGVTVTSASGDSVANSVTGATTVATDAPFPLARSSTRSTDWKRLPKQKWESYDIAPPPEVDALGFDKRNKVSFHPPTSFDIEAIPAKEKLPFLGQIVGSRSESVYLAMNDTVYIRTQEAIKVGETYALTEEPTALKFGETEKIGYSYQIMGQVKIQGVQDNLFVGRILTARAFVSRGTYLIPLPPKIPVLAPIAGPTPLESTVMFDHHFSTFTSAQHKQVFIGAGTDDGVQPGMVFRVYQHTDPSNEEQLTTANFIIEADMMVIRAAETISSALVINSKSPIREGSRAVLLTDISDLISNKGFREKGTQPDGQEDLDKLDTGDSTDYDKKELKQLENWKGNPEGQGPSEINAIPPPPDSESPPPPPNPDELNKASEPPPQGMDDGTPPPPPSEAVPPPPDDSPPAPPSEGAAPPPSDDAIAPQVPTDGNALAPPAAVDEPIVNLEPPPAPPSSE